MVAAYWLGNMFLSYFCFILIEAHPRSIEMFVQLELLQFMNYLKQHELEVIAFV